MALRKDLCYRLNVFPVEIPPLRERLDVIAYLVEVILKKFNRKYGKNIHFERQYLKKIFSRSKGNVKRAAVDAGISTRHLNKLMLKYGIRKEEFKG